MNLYEVAEEIVAPAGEHLPARRGRSPAGLRRDQEVPGGPALARLVLFYEYFHGDNGAGLGASHQTGWTGAIARLHALVRDDDGRAGARVGQGGRSDGKRHMAPVRVPVGPVKAGTG